MRTRAIETCDALEDLADLRDELLAKHQEMPTRRYREHYWEWFKVTDAAVEEMNKTAHYPDLLEAIEELADTVAEEGVSSKAIKAFFDAAQGVIPDPSSALQQSITKARNNLEKT